MSRPIAIFDLDGTITDSAPLITDCVARTLQDLGLAPQSPKELRRWVGPPLSVSFRDFAGLSERDITPAIERYRTHYSGRMLEVPVFPHMCETLQTLYTNQIILAVASSKIERLLSPILEKLDLDSYFSVVCGSREDDPYQTKGEVIADALQRLKRMEVDTSTTFMIGDRHHDIDGGYENQLTTVGVTWSGTEVSEFAQADHIVDDPRQLVDIVCPRN
ncbi:MAG: HAD hydrolase-like protein [Actinomycetaceae bacterium]|nr:HAD hydrolase-like protein [Actinomycetaceae bacterium]